jgi:3-oxoacyl-[acyl-carrier-protein] synthase-3
VATGSYIPDAAVPNESFRDRRLFETYGRPFPAGDNVGILTRFAEITGIRERRYVPHDMVASDMAAEAGRRALAEGAVDPESLDYLVVAHNFGDVSAENPRSDLVPTLAARVKRKLGIVNPGCVAYDLPFGCPGWLQAIIQVHHFFRSGDARAALVIGAETLSRVCDPHDRDSMIYADGAGAAVLCAQASDEPVGILAHSTRSDTLDHAQLMWMGTSYDSGFGDGRLFLKMEGRRVYAYAITALPALVSHTLQRAGIRLADVRKLLVHQANAKMDEAILSRLFNLNGCDEVPQGLMPMTVGHLGNSSVATIPTLLDLMRRGQLEGHAMSTGDTVVLASVGAGMNANCVVYRCP